MLHDARQLVPDTFVDPHVHGAIVLAGEVLEAVDGRGRMVYGLHDLERVSLAIFKPPFLHASFPPLFSVLISLFNRSPPKSRQISGKRGLQTCYREFA